MAQAKERQHKGGRGKLSGLVIVLKGLVVVLLKKEKKGKYNFSATKLYNFYKKGMLATNGFGSYLNVERASQLVAALSLHSLYLSVVEGVEGKMLHFTVVLGRED